MGRTCLDKGGRTGSIVYRVIGNFLVAVADQNMGPMFAYRATDPNFYEIIGFPARNVNLYTEAIEAANRRNGYGHSVVSFMNNDDGFTGRGLHMGLLKVSSPVFSGNSRPVFDGSSYRSAAC